MGIFMLELCIAHETPMIVNHAPCLRLFSGFLLEKNLESHANAM